MRVPWQINLPLYVRTLNHSNPLVSTEMMQDAFRLSREGFEDGYAEIARLVAAGRHVVVERSIAYCPRTDA